MAKFEAGTLVRLKSGSPLMTAGKTSDEHVECYWFDGKKSEMKPFFEELLEVSQPEKLIL